VVIEGAVHALTRKQQGILGAVSIRVKIALANWSNHIAAL